MSINGLKPRCQQIGLHFFQRLKGESISQTFPASRSCPHSLVHGSSPPLHYICINIELSIHHSTISLVLSLLPSSSTYKDPCDFIRPSWITQDNLPISGTLIIKLNFICTLNSPLSYNFTHSCVLRSRTCIYLGTHYSAYHSR